MTLQGDAEPLKVHTPFFCSRYIGQTTPYPGANNTLTVSIVANTFFSANGSVITITGLSNADWQTGAIPLADGPRGLGHHLFFSAEPVTRDWTETDNRTKGRGYWDNVQKTLTLYVAADTDCATEYVFSFVLTNPCVQQSAPAISIEASWIADTSQIFSFTSSPPSEVKIQGAAFEHDMLTIPANTPYAQGGDAASVGAVIQFQERKM